MLLLKDVQEWLKPQISGITAAYIGKTDPLKEKVICIYGRANSTNNFAIGGQDNTSYGIKKISVLVQWSKNCDIAEQKAQSIYEILKGTQAIIGGKECFINVLNDEPVLIGTNDNDIFEYVIDTKITYKKG